MNKELVLKFVVGTNCRKLLPLKILFGASSQEHFQVASVFLAFVCGCALAGPLDAQTAIPDNGPVPTAQPADGPEIEVVTSAVQEAAASAPATTAALDETTPAVLSAVRQDLRFEKLPGYQRFKEIKDNSRKLQEGGRVYKIRWSRDGQKIGFTLAGQKKQFNVADGSIIDRVDNLVDKSLRDKVTAKPKVERAKQVTIERSPDKKWRAVYRNHNVVLEPKSKSASAIKVTKDGKSRRRFGTCCWVYGEELDQQSAMWWSPDSRKLAYYEVDESKMSDYFLTVDNTSIYTKLQTVRYPKAGDKNPKVSLHIYDIDTRKSVKVQLDGDSAQYLFNVRFSPSGEELLFSRMSRRQNKLDLMAADVNDGKTRVVVSETQVTWQNSQPLMRFLDDGKRFIWETERTLWKQFEIRNLDGEKITDVTDCAEFPCHKIELVDEAAGWIYYSAYSDPSNPYNLQLHRSKLDGTKKQRITSAALNHTAFQISPSHDLVVAVRERFDTPRSTAVYRCEDGKEIAVLAQADTKAAEAMGLVPPEIFEFVSTDGKTKIYGTLHKPSNFDPEKKYPLLIDVYGGPQSTGISNTWSPANPVCELGFLVAKVGNRGTVKRGKAFESANFRNLGGPDLDDQVSAVQFLGQRNYVDAGRVGIWGHSYGGYLSALGILKYPDVFHAAVAGSPVTDWKNYDTIYTERYMQTPRENAEGYKSSSCLKYAHKLKGKLLLVHGLIDDNVHPANTWQLAKVLQDKDKRFDMMVYPGFKHGVQSTYEAIRWEYFFRHLGL